MNNFDFLAWLVACSEEDKKTIWMVSHNQLTIQHYTNDRQIRAFWRSPPGILLNLWFRFYYSICAIPRNLAVLKWQIEWEYRTRRRNQRKL